MQTEQHTAAGPQRGAFDCLQCGRSLVPIKIKAQVAQLAVTPGSDAEAFFFFNLKNIFLKQSQCRKC